MPDQHARAVELALSANDDLGALFARMGYASAPNGRLMQIYRTARRALQNNLNQPGAVRETIDQLEASVARVALTLTHEAVTAGQKHGVQALAVHGIGEPDDVDDVDTEVAIKAWVEPVKAQRRSILAAVAIGAGAAEVLGNESSPGLLSPGPVGRAGAHWLAELFAAATAALFTAAANESPSFLLKKQAIAAIDERTTECCLRVHGQVRPIDGDFQLTGEPRYADRLDNPPFHDWCRTATALVLAREARDDLTLQMRAAAQAEIKARRDKSRVEIDPADARSRR